MKKIKPISKKSISVITTLAVFLAMLGIPGTMGVKAASIQNARDLISNSAPSGASVTHTFRFLTGVNLAANEYMEITFASGFTGLATSSITCPVTFSTTSVVSTYVLRCTASTTVTAATMTVTVTGMANPAKSAAAGVADAYTMNIKTKTAANAVIEQADVMVAIIDRVTVTATVASTLAFTVGGYSSSTINGASTTVVATSSTIPFGTLTSNTAALAGQQLKVTTNASDGFTVTIQQNANLTSNSGSDIDSFKDGVASTTAVAWTSPTATLGSEATYGHFGLTSDDATLSDVDHFGNNLWQGFDGTTVIEVMYNNGPADSATIGQGLTYVAYKVETSALQEAGDYTNTLTYICTPQY